MKYKVIRNTEIKASSIILGTNYFGTTISKEMSFEMMDYYLECGGNVFDTARVYAKWLPNGDGASERTIGEYMNTRKSRNSIVISTKAAFPDGNISRLSQKEIERDVDESLMTLKTDYIDILWLHRDDTNVGVEEIMDSLNNLVQKGKILSFGASNWTSSRIANANEYALKHGKKAFVASQIQWSLAKSNELEDKTLVQMNEAEYEFYRRTKMPVFAFSPQAKGFFEKFDKNALSDKAKARYLNNDNIETYKRLKEISIETGHSISALVVSYIALNEDFDAFPILGCSNINQLKDSLAAIKIERKYI